MTMTRLAIERRLAKLEAQQAARKGGASTLQPPSGEKLRWVIGRLMEMGYFHPRMRATSDAVEQRRRQLARLLWPEQWDEWLAKAEEAEAEEVEREAVS